MLMHDACRMPCSATECLSEEMVQGFNKMINLHFTCGAISDSAARQAFICQAYNYSCARLNLHHKVTQFLSAVTLARIMLACLE